MHIRTLSSVLSISTIIFLLFSLSCVVSSRIDPLSPVDHYGFVEGFVTLDGKPADSVDIYTNNSATFSPSRLGKKCVEKPLTNDSIGFYRVALTEGTYNFTFQKNISNRNLQVDKFMTVVSGKTCTLNVDLKGLFDTLKCVSIRPKTLSISCIGFASYYQLFRSKDSINWGFVPGTQVSPSGGKRVYTETYSSFTDSVPEYGIYYYKLLGYSANESLIYETKVKKVTVENNPPMVKSISFIDSIKYLYCNVQLNTGFADYSLYRVAVLRVVSQTLTFAPYDTIIPFKPANDNSGNYQFVFRDSSCDSGSYAFKFYSYDKLTGKKSDTSSTYVFQYKKTAAAPTLSITDNLLSTSLIISRTGPSYTTETFEIFRSKRDSSNALALDTVSFSTASYTYLDFSAVADTYFYAVKSIRSDNVISPRSKFVSIIHNTTPAAPVISSLIDSGTYIRIGYISNSTILPVVVFRSFGKDTVVVDTIISLYSQPYESVCRNYPSVPGLYSYALAHLGANNEIGKKSQWFSVNFLNSPPSPGITLFLTAGMNVSCRITNISNISGIILKRSTTLDGAAQKIDTIHSSEFHNFELTNISLPSITYTDTPVVKSSYYYTVTAFSLNGALSQKTVASIYFPALLPPPPPPLVSAFDFYITLSFLSTLTSSKVDSVIIYRAKDSLTNFVLIRSLPISPGLNFNDSIFASGKGVYYYKIKVKKGDVASDFSLPVEAYYSGLLQTPASVILKADSNSVKIIIPPYRHPVENLILYRQIPGRNDYDQIAVFDSTASDGLIIIDTIRLAGIISYKTKSIYKNLSSLFSKEMNISVPGTGYQVFTAPVKNAILKQSTTFQIKWNPLNVSSSTISLELLKGTTQISILVSYNENQPGSYSWSIPTSVVPGDNYCIKMYDYYNENLLDSSPNFTISAQ